MELNLDSAIVLFAADCTQFVGSEGRKYLKEIIHVGKFSKNDQVFDVTQELLLHWKRTFDKFQEFGIKVPVPVEHTTDPEKNRGEVVEMETAMNSRGIPALFATIEFRDEEAEKLAKTAQVSIFSPPKFEDGQGRVYYRPIRHVALTDYPVVSQLDEFQVIAASFDCGPKNKDKKMSTLSNLATSLGIEFEKDSSDEVIADKISTSFKTLSASIEDMRKKAEGNTGDDDDDDDEKKKEPEISASLQKKLLAGTKKARELELSALVREGKITKAVCDDLVSTWCCEESLAFSLEHESGDQNFEALIQSLSKNDPVISFEESSGPQSAGTNNPLVADAEARAEAAK